MKTISTIVIQLFIFLLVISGIEAQVTGGFLCGGYQRTYTVYVPSTWSPGGQYPLLIALHGLTQTGNEMMLFSGFNTIAEDNRFLVVYPDGVLTSWNVGFPGGSTADDVGFLSALIDTLNTRYSVDLTRVYATGFSNGGFMCYRLGCELGNRIAAIASVSGTMTDGSLAACQPQRLIPVMHIHGTNDYVVPFNGGYGNQSVNAVLSFWTNYNNCPALPVVVDLPDLVPEGSTVQTQTWSPCDDTTEVKFYKVLNGGHAWPGSVIATGSGLTNEDINASQEIWNFVSRFTLDLTTGIRSFTHGSFVIYPNPAIESVTIRFPRLIQPGLLELYNACGIKVMDRAISSGLTTFGLHLESLPRGLYFVRVSSGVSHYSGKLTVE